MVRDEFDDVGDLCLDRFTYNENVVKQMSYDPDDYILDDTEEWYNQSEID